MISKHGVCLAIIWRLLMIHIEIFIDPIMGLSYESEPFLRYLETHFEGKITFSL